MTDLDRAILQAIETRPGNTARQIAAALGVDKRLVGAALYGSLRGEVRQDSKYRWYLKSYAGMDAGRIGSERLETPLARLCRYYLDCLSHDDLGGVSEFASSNIGRLNYVELSTLPMLDEAGADPFDTDAGRQLLGHVRRDRNRQALFLGYPVRLNLIRSRRSNCEGFIVEPLLLFPFQETDRSHGQPVLADDLPQINFRALSSLSISGGTGLMEEAIQLAEELGLDNAAGEYPELDDLFARMQEIRPDWDWHESLDPYALSSGPRLDELDQQGIYNRAIIVAAERSPYTRGLETELGALQSVDESQFLETALGAWLTGETIDSPPVDQQPLLEVLPLNSEQRQAVRQALSNPLTVITGPPGTGKSQVVTSILVNAAWQGKTVLFASKNNKAVDVVEARVNALGPRPVLLRLGPNQYQARLAEYLVALLAANATTEDQDLYFECKSAHEKLQERFQAIDAELQAIVELRNQVDALEQRVERIRQDMGNEVFARVRAVDRGKLQDGAKDLQAAIDRVDAAKLPFLTRCLWRFVRAKRFERLSAAVEAFRETSYHVGLPVPEAAVDESTVSKWIRYGQMVTARVAQVIEAQQYFSKLASLTTAPSIEDLTRSRVALTDELSANSEALWKAWLRLQPARMSPGQRRLLGSYSALLQMMVSANDRNQRLGRDVFQRYHQLFPKVTDILSCWAITSLAARGRIPFEPNFFDLLVVDEASQCDIASAIPLLFRARRVVVIGDPKQLRHISTLPKHQDQQLMSKHGLLEEHPGWAYSFKSLFDLASSLCRSDDIVTLRDHHRSHADIIEFSNEEFYEGRLRVATRYNHLRRPRPDGPAVRWVHVQGRTVRPPTGGAVNEDEARKVLDELDRLIEQGYRGSIGVVSPFRAQANRIRDLVHQHDRLSRQIAEFDFLADTVHRFQGDERDVMIFSPVVSTGATAGALGFLNSNGNLFNVAITRARAALVVVGDRSAATNSGVDYLSRFAAYADRLGQQRAETEVERFIHQGPEYPAVSNPDQVSDWERFLYRALCTAGIHPIPQYPVEKYVLDFAVVTDSGRLNIEVDGERYHRNWDGELCRRDQIRNQRLMELGWDVMRFWVYQVRDDLGNCIARVRQWVREHP